MKAKDILNTPEKWIKDYMARTPDGTIVDPCSSDANYFCAVGALRAAYGDESPEYSEAYIETYRAIKDQYGNRFWSITCFNDHPDTTFEDVRKVLEAADV